MDMRLPAMQTTLGCPASFFIRIIGSMELHHGGK
ncbi:hypothetical protein QFZ81_007322 [Paenibacillus sp. V4I9]|nr:hypothetical protein [Paenibacillus sp. V4I9]